MLQTVNLIVKRLAITLFLAVFILSGITTYALSDAQRKLFESRIQYFDAESCGNTQDQPAPAKGAGGVYIVGDSLTAAAKDVYKTTFSSGGWTPTTEGLNNRHIVGGLLDLI